MIDQEKVRALFNIHSGEGKMVLLLLGLGLLEMFANVMARTTTYALFLAEFDAATLPYAYIGIAISATLVSAAYLKLTERYPLGTVLLSNQGFMALLLFGLWFGTAVSQASWVIFAQPIAFGVLNTLVITAYWGLIGRVFNIQQGKRLTGLIATAETIAFLVGGFLMPLMVRWVGGAVNLLLAAAVLSCFALAMQFYVNRYFGEQLAAAPQPAGEAGEAEAAKPSGALSSRYVRLIFALFTLFIIGIYVVDNIFFALAELQYPDADQLASFVGLFWGASSALVLLMQGFVSGRIMIRFGVGMVMLLTPGIVLVETGLMAVVGSIWGLIPLLFWLSVTTNISRVVLDATDQAAVNILYQPLPADIRTRAQTIVNGILYPISIGLAGVLLLLFRQVLKLDVVETIYVLLVIAAAWFIVALLLRRAYPQALLQALTRRDFGDAEYLICDAASLQMFRQSLSSPRVGVVIYSLDMLQQVAPEVMIEQLPLLLNHPEAQVRLDVLRRIEALGLASAVAAIRQQLPAEANGAVRGAALQTLAVLGEDEDLLDEIVGYLEHPDAQLRQGALVGLLRGGQIEGIIDPLPAAEQYGGGPVVAPSLDPDRPGLGPDTGSSVHGTAGRPAGVP